MPAVLEETILSWIRSQALLSPGDFVLCALSGGADSVAMTRVLYTLRQTLELGGIAAAHFNHGLRGEEADRDQEFCVELCEKLDIPFFYGGCDVAAAARELGLGLEAAGRRMRYAFLMETALEHDFSKIATAHTADDNAETMLLNMTRGSGLTGLTGIPPRRALFSGSRSVTVIRPMLNVSREDELLHLEKLGQEYCVDSSNKNDEFRRNRIRHYVMPNLRNENPALLDALSRMAELLKRDMEYLEQQASQALEAISTGPGTVSAEKLAALPKALSGRVVKLMCRTASDDENMPEISSKHIDSVLDLCSGSPSAEVYLPGGLVACRIYSNLTIHINRPALTFKPVKIAYGQTVSLGELGLKASWTEKPKKVNNLVYSFTLNFDTIRSGLIIRPRKDGDSIRLSGKRGTKSLHNLFIDSKIPRTQRGAIPILADDTGVVAVGGFGVASRCAPDSSGEGASFQIYREE